MAFTGCRPLTLEEQEKVHQALESKRDKALFTLQLKCGFRISELLSLRVKDVCAIAAMIHSAEGKQEEKKDSKDPMRANMFQCISVQRKHAKKKLKGRTVPLNPKAQLQLKQWIEEAQLKPDDFLFPPWTNHHEAKLTTTRPIHYHSAWRIYKKAFAKCGIVGPAHTLGKHVGRKCFAKKMKPTTMKSQLKSTSSHRQSFAWQRLHKIRPGEEDVRKRLSRDRSTNWQLRVNGSGTLQPTLAFLEGTCGRYQTADRSTTSRKPSATSSHCSHRSRWSVQTSEHC